MDDKQFDLIMRFLMVLYLAVTQGPTPANTVSYTDLLADFMQYQINRDVEKFVEDPRDGQPISPENL